MSVTSEYSNSSTGNNNSKTCKPGKAGNSSSKNLRGSDLGAEADFFQAELGEINEEVSSLQRKTAKKEPAAMRQHKQKLEEQGKMDKLLKKLTTSSLEKQAPPDPEL